MNTTPWPRRMAALSTLSAALAFTGPGLAQRAPAQSPAPTGTATTPTTPTTPVTPGTAAPREAAAGARDDRAVRASQLIGMKVYDRQGKALGEIEDLIVGLNDQQLHHVVLGAGGVLGLGEKLVPVPGRLLELDGERAVVDLSPQRLDKAPSFKGTQWPDWNRKSYREQLKRFHGPSIRARIEPDLRLGRASELIGRDVNDLQGGDAGEIEDLVIKVRTKGAPSSQVDYVVIDFDRAWSPVDKLLPLPMDTLRIPTAAGEDAELQVPRDVIERSQGFDNDHWPDIDDAAYRDRLERELRSYHVFSIHWKPQGDPPATPPARPAR